MYYIKYNGIDLTSIVNVREVSIPSLPSMSHSEMEIFERDGGLYNGMSYGTREIKLTMIIKADNAEDYDTYVRDVKRAFYTKDEAPLYCGDENLYIICVPVDDMYITELGTNCAEVEVNLVSYDPYWYSNTETYTEGDEGVKSLTVVNKGDVGTYPNITVCVGSNTSFIQLENKVNQSKILIGDYPTVGLPVEVSSKVVLDDPCGTTNGWTQSTISIEQDTANGGTIGISDSGRAIKCADFGNASGATWHGACYRQNLDEAVTDFKVKARLRHNSTGKNGDPTVKQPYNNDTSQVLKGTKTTYYMVNKKGGLEVKKSPEKKAKSWGTIKNGTKIEKFTVENGWIKFSFKTKNGYLKTSDLKKMVKTNTETVEQINMVTTKPTAIRTEAKTKSVNQKTIPTGKCIRVTKKEYGDKTKFYKLAKKYDGKMGYVLKDHLVKASDYTIEYEEMYELADDKTGKIILGGYSSDGTQLFSLSLRDDNEYYEFTYPLIKKNGKDFLVDKTVAPKPKIDTEYKESGDELVATKSYALSGKYGSWNEFYGFMYIERINNQWYAYVAKEVDGKIVKKIESEVVTDTTNGSKKLAFVLLYIGTTGEQEKSCAMSLTDLEIQRASKEVTTEEKNWQDFVTGDVIRIDNSIPMVYVNSIPKPGLIDVGSDFFKLETGENEIVLSTVDSTPVVTITHVEKYL